MRRARPILSTAARCGVLGLAVIVAACAPATPGPRAPAPAVVREGRITDHVVIVSVDGLRPDAIARFSAPTLQRLVAEGSFAGDAQTVLPSTTLPSHTSMLTGVDPTVHGVTWNEDETTDRGYVRVPTIFALARKAGFRTAAFFGKSKLNHVHEPTTLDHVHSLHSALPWRRSGQRTARVVGDYLRTVRPNLLFVHLTEVDFAGHMFGWMGRLYGNAVADADAAVAKILEHCDAHFGAGRYTVILTADHGGQGHTHGTDSVEDTTIPWVAWGEGVRSGFRLGPGIRTTDTAATALWLLGVPVPSDWTGHPVTHAFDSAASSPMP